MIFIYKLGFILEIKITPNSIVKCVGPQYTLQCGVMIFIYILHNTLLVAGLRYTMRHITIVYCGARIVHLPQTGISRPCRDALYASHSGGRGTIV